MIELYSLVGYVSHLLYITYY